MGKGSKERIVPLNDIATSYLETYIKDIKERYGVRHDDDLSETINIIASSIGLYFSLMKNGVNPILTQIITLLILIVFYEK